LATVIKPARYISSQDLILSRSLTKDSFKSKILAILRLSGDNTQAMISAPLSWRSAAKRGNNNSSVFGRLPVRKEISLVFSSVKPLTSKMS
jgi:hypothetical protein